MEQPGVSSFSPDLQFNFEAMFAFTQVFFSSIKQDQGLFASSLRPGVIIQTISPTLLH